MTNNDFKAGDRVEVIAADMTYGNYQNGDILTIKTVTGSRLFMEEFEAPYVQRREVRHVAPAPSVITINRAEDAAKFALDALELHGVPPTDTGGWRTAVEQSFQKTSDADLVYTAWLHLKALSLRTARETAAKEAAELARVAGDKLQARRDEVAVEYFEGAYDHLPRAGYRRLIDRIIELEDAANVRQ